MEASGTTALKKSSNQKKTVLKRKSVGLTRTETDKLQIVFDMFDLSKDGTIDKNEIEKVLQRFTSEGALSPGVDCDLLLESIHNDEKCSTPRVGFQDFKSSFKKGMTHAMSDQIVLEDSFQLFDTDRDGFISLQELQEALPKFDAQLTEADIADIFKEADANKDGKIDLQEYLVLMDKVAMA